MELTKVFAKLLIAEIGIKNVRIVNELNESETDKDICRSHDFCDANQVMIDAFNKVFKKDPDPSDQHECDVINAAWSQAKRNKFYIDLVVGMKFEMNNFLCEVTYWDNEYIYYRMKNKSGFEFTGLQRLVIKYKKMVIKQQLNYAN